MERSAWPKNLSSGRKHAIQELLHGRNPTKKLSNLFDAHSQTGNNTRQPLLAEDLFASALSSFSNTLSESMSAESDEVLQVPTNACVLSEVSEESESINTPVPRNTLDTWTRQDQNLIDDGHQWRTYDHKSVLSSELPGGYMRCAHQIEQGCQAAKQVEQMEDDPPLYMMTYRGLHTCDNLILKSPQLIMDSPIARDDSIPLNFNTSLIAEQDDNSKKPIFYDFLSVNQEQKLPSEDDLNPHGHSHDDNSNDNNQSALSDYYDYYNLFESYREISGDQGAEILEFVLCDLFPHGHSHDDNSNNNNQSALSDYYNLFESYREISGDQGAEPHGHSHDDNSNNNNQSALSDYYDYYNLFESYREISGDQGAEILEFVLCYPLDIVEC